VALANKMARIAWALMTRKEVYRRKDVSRLRLRDVLARYGGWRA
jgi:hypothetical protein